MPLDFPSSPSLNDTYSLGPRTWKYNGIGWEMVGTNIGYTGSAGYTGSLGYTGSQGVGFTGSQGTTGFTGSTGSVGNIVSEVVFNDQLLTRPILKDYALAHNVLGSVTGSVLIDLTLGNFVSATLIGNVTWTFTNPVASPNVSGFSLELVNGGAYTITWPSSVRWPGGTAPSLTVSGVDILTFVTDDGGTNWRGAVSMLDSK